MREQLTESDVKKIQEEIDHRKLVVRKEAIEAVKEARASSWIVLLTNCNYTVNCINFIAH